MTWDQILAMNAPMITVVVGLFVWLRADIKRLEDKFDSKLESEIRRLESRWDADIKRLEDKWDADIKRLEDKFDSKLSSEIGRLEERWDTVMTRLEEKLEAGFMELEARLRGVETEQARVAGLLEGLALTGRLPEPS